MRRDIRIEQRADPVVRGGAIVAFTVSYTGRDPETVAAVTNTLASFYLTENIRVREEEASGTAGFLRKQLEDVKKRLEDQEARVSAFKRRHIGENPKNMEANLAVLERITAQLRLNSDNQNRALERREALARQLAGSEGHGSASSESAGREPRGSRGGAARRGSTRSWPSCKTRFSDKYPDVVRLKGEIAALEAQMRGAPGDGAAAPIRAECAPNPFAFKLRAGHRRDRGGDRGASGRGAAASRGLRHVPAPRGEHAAPGAGVPGAVSRLRDDERAVPDAAQALRGSPARRDPGAAPEGRAVPDPGGGDSAECPLGAEPCRLLPAGGDGAVGGPGSRCGAAGGAAGRIVPRRRRPAECRATSRWSRGFRASSATLTRREAGGGPWPGRARCVAMIVLTTAAAYATARGHVPIVSSVAQALFLRS